MLVGVNLAGQFVRRTFGGSFVFRMLMFAFAALFGGPAVVGAVVGAAVLLATLFDGGLRPRQLMDTAGVVFGGGLFLALAAMCLALGRRRVVISAEGVKLVELRRTRLWTWSQIASVEIGGIDPDAGMVHCPRLVLASGEKVDLHAATSVGSNTLSDAEQVTTAIRQGMLEHRHSTTS